MLSVFGVFIIFMSVMQAEFYYVQEFHYVFLNEKNIAFFSLKNSRLFIENLKKCNISYSEAVLFNLTSSGG